MTPCLVVRRTTLLALLACLGFCSASTGQKPNDPKPKSDAEQIVGTWELPIAKGRNQPVLQLTFRADGSGGQFTVVRPTAKEGESDLLGAAGFKFELATRDGKKLLLLNNCLWLEKKKAEIEYQLTEGKLKLLGGALGRVDSSVIAAGS